MKSKANCDENTFVIFYHKKLRIIVHSISTKIVGKINISVNVNYFVSTAFLLYCKKVIVNVELVSRNNVKFEGL